MKLSWITVTMPAVLSKSSTPFSQLCRFTRISVKPPRATQCRALSVPLISTSWISRPVELLRSTSSVEPPAPDVMRLFLIVTLGALTVIGPLMSLPSTTVPAVLIVMPPLGVSVVPTGTPVFDAFGNPVDEGDGDGVGVGVGDGLGDGV